MQLVSLRKRQCAPGRPGFSLVVPITRPTGFLADLPVGNIMYLRPNLPPIFTDKILRFKCCEIPRFYYHEIPEFSKKYPQFLEFPWVLGVSCP